MTRRYLKILFSLFLSFPGSSWAWGSLGHQTVALIASHHVTGETQYQIDKILGGEDLVEASLWPDTVKKQDPWTFTGPYHYVNMDAGKTYWDSSLSTKGDALRALAMYAEALGSSDVTDENKKTALRMITHLIGDLHQPLHMGLSSDWGGNKILFLFDTDLQIAPTDSVPGTGKTYTPNLHSLWDDDIPKYDYFQFCKLSEWPMNAIEYSMCLEKKFSFANEKAVLDLETWMQEDALLLKNVVMNFDYVKDSETDKASIHKSYMDAAAPIASKQIYLAGMRLAMTLNAILGDQSKTPVFAKFSQKVKKKFGDQSFDFFILDPEKK